MARNPYRTGRATDATSGRLTLTPIGDEGWRLDLIPDDHALKSARAENSAWVMPSTPILLARWDPQTDALDTFPLNTTSFKRGLFHPKYRRLSCIRFEAFGFGHADTVEEAEATLEGLPSGFIRSAQAGLGIDYEIRYIPDALEELAVDRLIIQNGSREKGPRLDGRDYVIARSVFDKSRRAIRAVHEKALGQAAEEKDRIAANALLHTVDPTKFPLQPPTYRPGGVTALVSDRDASAFSKQDRRALVHAARSAVRTAATEEPSALLALSRDIEVVTLEGLIAKIESLLAKQVAEAAWQRFFEANSFVLRLAFGYPVIQMRGQVSVGGGRFDGAGEKIADFAVRAAATGNLALIEIKTGETQLLEKTEYRTGVYAPFRELSGAVSQVLDQIYQLQTSFPVLVHKSGAHDVEAYAIQGLVIAGRSPEGRERQKSLELYRQSLRTVTVITFDELLEKLRALKSFLSEPDAGPPPGSEDPAR